MQVKTGTYCSSNGTDTIFYRIYRPDCEPVGLLQIAHGMSEHMGRYGEFAAWLADRGFLVFGNDHIGHGESAADPSDFGYFGKEKGWVHLVDDMRLLTRTMTGYYPKLPCFLMGHSMGSLLARAYLSCYGEDLAGAILMGTSGNNPMAALTRPLISVISAAKGDRYRSRLLYGLAFGNYTRQYAGETDKLGWMTQNRDALDQFRKDPKCNFIFTVAGFRDLLDILSYVSRREWALELPRRLPVLLVSGDMDPVGDYARGVRKVHKTLLDAGMRDVSLNLYRDNRHELLNEPGKQEVIEDIHRWLKHRLPH